MNTYDPSAGVFASIAALFAVLFIPILIVSVVLIIANWKIYEKAGKPGWAAIIPIYNVIVLLEIVGKPVWWIILFLIPCVNIIFAIWTTNLLSKSFGQSEGFTVGLVLLPYIFYPILGFGNYKYMGPAGIPGGMSPIDPSIGYKDPFIPPPTPPSPPAPPQE